MVSFLVLRAALSAALFNSQRHFAAQFFEGSAFQPGGKAQAFLYGARTHRGVLLACQGQSAHGPGRSFQPPALHSSLRFASGYLCFHDFRFSFRKILGAKLSVSYRRPVFITML